MEKKLFIKNMVCNRCIKVIQTEIEILGIALKHIELDLIIYEEKSKNDFGMSLITYKNDQKNFRSFLDEIR